MMYREYRDKATPGLQLARGYMLIEVLISVLLFALGFIVVLGLQGRSLAITGDTQYRAEAVHLANAYVAEMWAYRADVATLQNLFTGNGSEFVAFENQVRSAIPYAATPVVTIDNNQWNISQPGSGALVTIPSVRVVITISWIDKDTAATNTPITHNYTHVTALGFQTPK